MKVVISIALFIGMGLLGCDAPPPVIPDSSKQEVATDDAIETDNLEFEDSTESGDTTLPLVDATVEDTLPVEDIVSQEDTAEVQDTAESDISAEPDVEEEDLSGVKLTWKKDIEPISIDKCDNCHGKDGSHGLKLYTKQKWIDYFPMIIPALEKGSMPQGTSLAPGQFEEIMLWGKIGYP